MEDLWRWPARFGAPGLGPWRQLQPAKLLPPAVERLGRDLRIPAGLWSGLFVRNLDFNLPQQRCNLLQLAFLHRHASFLPEGILCHSRW